MYVKGSCQGGFVGPQSGFTGEITCANDRLARSAVVERAWASVTAPKVVRNDSEVSWSSWLRS